jgi:hypothetical protein
MDKLNRKKPALVADLDTRRPPPPEELNEAQASEWRAVVARFPQDYFRREHYALLIAYCQHVCRSRWVAQQIEAFEPEWLGHEGGLQRLDKLHQMAERESKLIMALARSMRLTHQAQLKAETAYTRAHAVSPLEPTWQKYGAFEND